MRERWENNEEKKKNSDRKGEQIRGWTTKKKKKNEKLNLLNKIFLFVISKGKWNKKKFLLYTSLNNGNKIEIFLLE